MAQAVVLVAAKIGAALGNEATNQAGSQFSRFVTQLTELQDSMGRIRRELRVMHDFLCQIDIPNRNNQAYETWIEEVRKLAQGIEDIVDEYLYLIDQKQNNGCCFYLKKGFKQPKTLFALKQIASLLERAERNLAHLFQVKDRWIQMTSGEYSCNPSYLIEKSQYLASTSHSIGETDLVGIEENRRKLTEWLMRTEPGHYVIAVQGMGGLGKTTLATDVYKREQQKFDCHAWISISQKYSVEDLLRRMIAEVYKDRENTPSDIATMNVISLKDKLKGFLEQKKYLIILDDVWAPELFNDLSASLPRNNRGSKVIITTRIAEVAALSSEGCMLKIEPLSDDESRELFCKRTFPNDTNHECPQVLKDLSEQIVGKCQGLPLAIVSLGSLLSVRERTVTEWKQINDQAAWELANNPSLGDLRNILNLSYIYLPTYLKNCFLYCSMFPEDHLLRRKKLIRLWIAEGFVEERGKSTLEEVAEGYLKELVHRNMLQLVQRNAFGRLKYCRMHDIVRELAINLSRKESFHQVSNDNEVQNMDSAARRLVINRCSDDTELGPNLPNLRSFMVFDTNMPAARVLSCISSKFKYLSVLELQSLHPMEKVPDSVGDLFNLRYLCLRGSKVKLLPKSIEKLYNLQTLDLRGCEMQELPRGIAKLKKLRHLFVDEVYDLTGRDFRCGSGVCIPMGLCNLTNLQTLQAVEARDDSIRHLGNLRQLRSFTLWSLKATYCADLCQSFSKMQFLSSLCISASDENEVLHLENLDPLLNLQKLELRGRLVDQEAPEFHLVDQEAPESPLLQISGKKLLCLKLCWSRLREDPLLSLSRLSDLTELHLTRAYEGQTLLFRVGWFPQLKSLWLRDLPNLNQLEIQEGAMMRLEFLLLVHLEELMEIPQGIQFLVSLKFAGFYETPPRFFDSLRQCSQIKHIRWRCSVRGD